MFKIATILRTKQAPNLYRETLLRAFSHRIGDDYLLCSGFFQEKKYKSSSYYASKSFLTNPPPCPCTIRLTTVGVYDKRVWGPQYDDFALALATMKCRCGGTLRVEKRRPKGGKWHAKVFMARDRGAPILAIIGSSNITKNAFDVMSGWNRECDAVIWDTAHKRVDDVVRTSLTQTVAGDIVGPESADALHEVMISRYDQEDALNSRSGSMQQRLGNLWDDVIDATSVI